MSQSPLQSAALNKKIDTVLNMLRESATIPQALERLKLEKSISLTRSALHGLLWRRGLTTNSYLNTGSPRVTSTPKSGDKPRVASAAKPTVKSVKPAPKPAVQEAAPKTDDADVGLLLKTLKKRSCGLRYLCDDIFHTSPKNVEDIIKNAQSLGANIWVQDDKISYQLPDNAVSSPIQVVSGGNVKEYQIGVISDMHFGSLYAVEDAVTEHVNYCYEQGITEIFCPGDMLEGCYRHARMELSAVRWEDQAALALSKLPQLPGLSYHFIDGNHDFTFTELIGIESGKNLVRLAADQDRHDLKFYGSRGATLDMGGTLIELWHPKKSGSYAKSYPIQNHIRDTAPQSKPHILLVGHWHTYIQLCQQECYAVSCGTFQHGQSPFGRSIGGDVALGGVIVKWASGQDGYLRSFSAQHFPVRTVKAVSAIKR